MSYVIDQVNCTACHRCRVECPVQAITFRNAKYWIDPDKCVSCGHCVTVCHNECISNPDAPAPVVEKHDKIVKDCDVCVIGGGAAGTIAAARAAANGCKVILLEKGQEVGGSAWYAHMFKSHWSHWHEAAGIPDPREQVLAQFEKKVGDRCDTELFHRLLDADVDLVNWLIDEHDLAKDYELGPFGPGGAMGLVSTYHNDYNKIRIDTTIGPGGNGWWLCLKFLSILEQNGGEVLYHTPAKHILLDGEGKVSAVLAEDAGGEVQVNCKSVVVAAGAFTRNHEIMDKMQPLFYDDEGKEPVHIFTCSRCTGDGITMCEELGADVDYENRRVNLFGPARHPYPCVTLRTTSGMGSVMINAEGDLFQPAMGMTEVSALVFQPGRYCWSIVDHAMIESAVKESMNPTTKDVVDIDLDKFFEKWEEVLVEEEVAGSLVSAPTIAELAEKIGVDPQKLEKIVADSNANSGKMPMMGPPMGDGDEGGMPPMGGGDEGGMPMPMGDMKMPEPKKIENPPYYAVKLKLFHENAVGGMKTDSTTNVLASGKAIPGLYAAGDNIRGIMLPGDIGVGYIESVLSALTVAFCSGYVSGVEAAKYVQK